MAGDIPPITPDIIPPEGGTVVIRPQEFSYNPEGGGGRYLYYAYGWTVTPSAGYSLSRVEWTSTTTFTGGAYDGRSITQNWFSTNLSQDPVQDLSLCPISGDQYDIGYYLWNSSHIAIDSFSFTFVKNVQSTNILRDGTSGIILRRSSDNVILRGAGT